MIKDSEPLVSVVTPVYNGRRYIAECVEGVLNQEYSNWEYIIVNNCSTDNTLDIVRSYAEKDSRIKVENNREFLRQVENFNHAIGKISPGGRYCCLLMADDILYPGFLAKMVELGEKHPSVGIVASRQQEGERVRPVNLSPETSVLSGREVGRGRLLGTDQNLFGSLSTVIIKSEIVRKRDPVFDEREVHADTDFMLDVLREWDLGFVHEILCFIRRHEESMTSGFCHRFATLSISRLSRIVRYGSFYLEESEKERIFKHCLLSQNKQVARRLFSRNGMKVWRYHRSELRRLGIRYNWLVFIERLLLNAGRRVFALGRGIKEILIEGKGIRKL